MIFKFKDGTEHEGSVLAEFPYAYVTKQGERFFLVNKLHLLEDKESVEGKDDNRSI